MARSVGGHDLSGESGHRLGPALRRVLLAKPSVEAIKAAPIAIVISQRLARREAEQLSVARCDAVGVEIDQIRDEHVEVTSITQQLEARLLSEPLCPFEQGP